MRWHSLNNREGHHPDFADAHPTLPRSFAYPMRNALAHWDFKVGFKLVWTTIHCDLPSLHSQIQHAQVSVHNGDIEETEP